MNAEVAGKKGKFVYWTPRVVSILFICFLALFSLDVFGEDLSFWETVLAFLMHNIPAFVLALVLWISWKYEIVGGVAFILVGLVYIAFVVMGSFEWYMLVWIAQISGVAFFIGSLFLVGWFRKKK